jgi:hypothetical protein
MGFFLAVRAALYVDDDIGRGLTVEIGQQRSII